MRCQHSHTSHGGSNNTTIEESFAMMTIVVTTFRRVISSFVNAKHMDMSNIADENDKQGDNSDTCILSCLKQAG